MSLGAGDVFYRAGWGGRWETIQAPGQFRHVAISGDGYHLWGIDSANRIWYMRVGSKSWLGIGGKLADLCVSYGGDRVWGMCVEGRLWTCTLMV